MVVRLNFLKIALLAAYIVALGVLLGAGASQPPFPNIYIGKVFIDGEPAPDGIEIFVRVDSYQSNAVPDLAPEEQPRVLVENGEYTLIVQPPHDTFFNKTITFHATRGFGDVQADETGIFKRVNLATSEGLENTLDLNFAEAPRGAPEPTPTPLPTPVLPIPGDPSVPNLSRVALIAGIAALVVGGGILFLMRRRKAF